MTESLLKDIDYARLKEVENIRTRNLNELPARNDYQFIAKAYNKTKLLFVALIVLYIASHFTQYELVEIAAFAVLFFGYPILLFILDRKYKIKYLTEHSNRPLDTQMFLDGLKDAGLEVRPDELEVYELYLKRYIEFYILKEYHELASRPSYLFEVDYTNRLTSEQLFISAILFKSYYSFIKHNRT